MADLFGYEAPQADVSNVVTEFLPWDWLDESIPGTAEQPEDFCEVDAAGNWHLIELKDEDGCRDDNCFDQIIQPGDIVAFAERRLYPSVILTVLEDRSFHVTPEVPADANCFYVDDPDLLTDTIETLVGCLDADSALDPGEHDLTNYHWSPSKILFEFAVLDICSGEKIPHFTRLGVEQ